MPAGITNWNDVDADVAPAPNAYVTGDGDVVRPNGHGVPQNVIVPVPGPGVAPKVSVTNTVWEFCVGNPLSLDGVATIPASAGKAWKMIAAQNARRSKATLP